jgi:methionyl-tRNA formyltransferase
MKIACVGYRNWALEIYDRLATNEVHEFLIFRSREEFDESKLRGFSPNLILFYGWSWIVKEQLLADFRCLMLHPSPLPKYRGGSPIQNQIIRDKTHSKITIFVMNSKLDAGDIVAQDELSLEGSIDEIFVRITNIGYQLTSEILMNGVKRRPQDEDEATYFSRRTPAESEITIEELMSKPASYLYNKIRMLQDPYPNPYIRTVDRKKLFIKICEIGE